MAKYKIDYMETQLKEFSWHKKHRLQRGKNSKIHTAVGIFNLPAGESCPNSSTCKDTCYAKGAEQRYSNVKASRQFNYKLAQTDLNLLEYMLVRQIKRQDIKIVRIHESGDFFNDEYTCMWGRVANQCPETQFYAYTKMYHEIGVQVLDGLKNVNIIDSFIDGKRNYGNEQYVRGLKQDYNAFECPYKGCMDSCKYCLTGKNVVFQIHGPHANKDNYKG